MAWDLTVMASDLDEMIEDLPAILTFGGADFEVIASEVGSDSEAQLAGIEDQHDMEVVIPVGDIAPLPTEGDIVQIKHLASQDAVAYRVLRIQDHPDGVARTLFVKGEEE